jgi:hypothetical protein
MQAIIEYKCFSQRVKKEAETGENYIIRRVMIFTVQKYHTSDKIIEDVMGCTSGTNGGTINTKII